MNLDSQWRHRRSARPLVFAGVAAVALAGGAGVGYAATHSAAGGGSPAAVVAAAPSSSPSPTPSTPDGGGPGAVHKGWRFFGGPGPGMLGGGVVHGQLTVPKSGGGYQTLDVQDGTVTAVSSTSITVRSADGFTASYAVTSSTLVNAKSAGIGSVKKGDTVFVTATASGSTATAAQIIDVTAIKAGRASFGFPFHDRKPGGMPWAPAAPAQSNA